MRNRCFGALLAALALAAAAGCNGTPAGHPPAGGRQVNVPPAEGGVLLRYKLAKDQVLRYELAFKMSSRGDGSVDEKMRAALYQTCLGPVGGKPDPKFWKVNLTRREVERHRVEVNRKGQKQPPIIATRTVEPDVTPNYGYDPKLNRNYFPINERGMFGLSGKAPFHRVVYDSLVYLMPVLPPGEVRAGGTWSADVPVYAGPDYFYPLGGYKRGNEFKLAMTGRVERIYQRGAETFARLRWNCSGIFDTSLYNKRYPPAFHNRRRIIHEVQGSGRALFNVTRGVTVSRDGAYTATFTFQSLTSRVRKQGRPPERRWEKTVNRHIIHYTSRLLADDEPDPAPRRR